MKEMLKYMRSEYTTTVLLSYHELTIQTIVLMLFKLLLNMHILHSQCSVSWPSRYTVITRSIDNEESLQDTAFVPQFHKFSVDMQTHTGVKIDGGAPAAPAAPAAAPPPWPLRRREDTINIT